MSSFHLRMKINSCIVLSLFLVSCESKNLNKRSEREFGATRSSAVFYGDYISGSYLAYSENLTLWSKVSAYLLGKETCAAASIAQLFDIHDFHNADLPTPLKEVKLDRNGSYRFAALKDLKFDENNPYIVRIVSCGKSFFRTITGSDFQDISVVSNILTFAAIENRLSNLFKKGIFNENARKSFEELNLALQSRGETKVPAKVYDFLVSDVDMVSLFKNVFSSNPELLRSMPPLLIGLTFPTSLKEGATGSFNASAVHWDMSYKMAYLWKLDETVLATKNSFAYKAHGNMRRSYNLYLYIGSADTDGHVDTDRAYLTYTKVIVISDDIPVTAPDFSIVTAEQSIDGDLIVSQSPFTVSLHTDANMKGCDSFSALKITEHPDAPDPIEEEFAIKCTTSNFQNASYTLSDPTVGTRNLYLWAIDNVGNVSDPKMISFIYDPLLANVVLSGVLTGESNIVNLDITVGGSNISHYRYKLGSSATTNCSLQAGYGTEIDIAQHITENISALSDGELRLCVLAKKSSGVWLAAASSAIAVWTKDTEAPTATITGALTGTTAQLTNNVIVSGADVVFYRYKLGLSASLDCTQSSGYSANVAVTTPITDNLSSLLDGAMQLCVLGVDAAGNVQPYASATNASWIKDTSAPTAIVASAPTGTQNVNNFTNLVVSGDRVTTYRYKYGLVSNTNCANATGYSGDLALSNFITIDTSSLSDGAMNLCVVGKNAANVAQAYADASVYSWTKDTTAPVATLSGDPSSPSNLTSITVTVAGTDVVNYRYKLGPAASINCALSSGYLANTSVSTTISANLSAFAEGELQLCVIGADAVGNWQAYADATTANWIKDTQTPTAVLTGVPTGHTAVTDLAVTVSGTGADYYKYKVESSASIDCSSSSGYSTSSDITDPLSVDMSSYADGAMTLCVIAGDEAGNWQDLGTASTATWTKDTEAPADFSITSPATLYVLQNIPTFNWQAATGAATYSLIIASDSGCTTAVQTYSSLAATSQTLTNLANGTYYICVTAVDLAGNTKIATNNAFEFIVDGSLPSSSLTIANNQGPLSNPQSDTTAITGTASDVGTGLDKVDVSLENNTTNLCLNSAKTAFDAACPQWIEATGAASWSLSIDDSVFVDSNYTVSSRATDVAGNIQSVLGAATLIWDSAAPTVSAVSIDEGALTAKRSIHVNVTANDNGGGSGLKRILIAERAATCASISNGQWFDWTGGASQTLNYRLSQFSTLKYLCVFAQDHAGNTSTISNGEVGTSGVDMDSIMLNTPAGPAFSSIIVSNSSNGSTTTIPFGAELTINWTITSSVGLAVNPIVKIEYSINAGWTWFQLPSSSTPASTYGSTTLGAASWSSSYSGWTSPTSDVFQVRIVARDVNDVTSIGVSAPLNAGKWSLWAGQNSVGNDGSATQALLGLGEIDMARGPFVVSRKTGHIFIYDANNGIRKIDALTGIISTYIAYGAQGLPYRTMLAEDSLGFVYYRSTTGVRRFDPAEQVANPTVYFEGGTQLGDNIPANDLYLNSISPVLAFDQSDNLYVITTSVGAACDYSADGVVSTVSYVYKVSRTGTAAGNAHLIAGNGSVGIPTYGQDAKTQPLGIRYCRSSSIAANSNGSIIYLSLYTGNDWHLKIANGKIYRANMPDNVMSGVFYFNPYTMSDKSFYYVPGSYTPPIANIYRFAPTTNDNDESPEVFIGGGSGSDCNADGKLPEEACPTAGAGLHVTPGNDLYWIDDRVPAASVPIFRIRTMSAGRVQTVAGSTGITGWGGSRLRALFGSLTNLYKDSVGNIFAYDKLARYIVKFDKDSESFSAVVGNGNNYVSSPVLGADGLGQNIGFTELFATTLLIDDSDQVYFRGYMNGLYYLDSDSKLRRVGDANTSNENVIRLPSLNGTVLQTLRLNFGTGSSAADSGGNIILGGGYWHSGSLGGPPRILKINPATGVITQLAGSWSGVSGVNSDASSSDGISAASATIRCGATQNAWTTTRACYTLNVRVYDDVVYFSEYDKIRTISSTDGTGVLGTLKNADGAALTLAASVGPFAITGSRLYYLAGRKLYCAWLGTAVTTPGDCNNTDVGPPTGMPAISNIDRGTGLTLDQDNNVIIGAGQTLLKYSP